MLASNREWSPRDLYLEFLRVADTTVLSDSINWCTRHSKDFPAWEGFQSWIERFHADKKTFVEDFFEELIPLYNDVSQKEFQKVVTSSSFLNFVVLYDAYLDYLRESNGKLSSFWMYYVDVEIMLGLLRASREGYWELHLSSMRQMIPWCFAYDNLNYAWYLSAYLSEMSNLVEDHPETWEYLKSGSFSV